MDQNKDGQIEERSSDSEDADSDNDNSEKENGVLYKFKCRWWINIY